MRRPSSYALLPMLLAACPGGSGTTHVTDASTTAGTGSSGASTGGTSDSDSTPTGGPTDGGPDSSTGPSTGPDPSGTSGTSTDPGTSTGSDTGDTGDTSGGTGSSSTGDVSTDTGTSTGVVGECSPGETAPCYSGPPETKGVGLCVAGEQTCDGAGVFGPCQGEVLPAMENCDDAGDEDCDGFDPCKGDGGLAWARTFGSTSDESGMRVAFDGAGNLVVAAYGHSALDFGGGVLQSGGGYDLFVARYSPDGEHLWSKRFGDGSNQFRYGHALAVDAAGEIVVAGEFQGTIDFGGGALIAKNTDTFLARLSADGEHVWSKGFKSDNSSYPGAVAFDAGGNVVIGGHFTTALDLGGGALVSAGGNDAFIGKFSPAGVHQWSQRFGDFDMQHIAALVTDAANNVYISGGFYGTINFGNGALASAGDGDVFLARLDPKGTVVWSKRFGDAKLQQMRDMVIDSKGRISLGGDLYGKIDLGGGPIGDTEFHSFVAQVDTSGNHLWSQLVSDGHASLHGIAVDGFDSVLMAGRFYTDGDFGGGKLVSEGSSDIFLVKLGPGGQHVWSQRFGDFQAQDGFDVAGSATGSVAVTGSFAGGINFGGGPTNSKGSDDGFLAVFGP